MSCRAIGKEIENYIINFIIDYRNHYFHNYELVGIFSESEKNKNLVSNFYEKNYFKFLNNTNDSKIFICEDFNVKYPNHISHVTNIENFN